MDLDPQVVYVRRADLSLAAADGGWPLLSDEERERAARFLIEEKRVQFVAMRGVLRRWLGDCLALDPAALRFAYGEHGKPHLIDSNLHFNVSHSEETGVIAIALDRPVGVDIQAATTGNFQAWVEREAYIKARGWAMPLEPVPVDPDWRVIPIDNWTPRFAAAVAARNHSWRVDLLPVL